MSKLLPLLRALDQALDLPEHQGFIETPLPEVRLFRATQPVPRAPLLYDTGIVIIGQGHKIGYLDGQRFRYDADNYLVLSVPLPFECETHASPAAPLLGVFIDIDPPRLRELVSAVNEQGPAPELDGGALSRGVQPAPLEADMLEAAARLLRCLQRPLDARVLGRAIVDELVYRVLLGPHGGALRALTRHHSPYARVARALALVHRSYTTALSVEALAHEASMSSSAFHRAFKQVTGESPLQYVKKVRLNKARSLLVHEGLAVSSAAYEVGYESASQFSREFKRYFSVSPSDARTSNYAQLTTAR